MTSARLPRDLTPNPTARALEALRARGIEIVDLTASNPTRAGLEYPPDLLAPLSTPTGLVYQPEPLGLLPAREAVSRDFARRGLDVPADRIALTASTSEAYAWLFKLLCDPGDNVLIPRPSYPLFEHLTLLEAVEAKPYRLEYHGAWRIDLGHVRDVIDGRTKAVLVVSPNNPTGSCLHEEDLHQLAELCAARNLLLIGDEVFADYMLDGAPHGVSVLNDQHVVACSLGGLSKTVGLPQLKLGWMGMSGPPERVEPLMRAYEVIADTFLSVSTPVQLALPELLERGAVVREQIQARTRRNLASLRQIAAETAEVSVLRIEGGWSAVIQVPRYRSEESLVLELLTADRVLVHPGYFYDFEREAFLVVSLLVEPAAFDAAVRKVLSRAASRTAHV